MNSVKLKLTNIQQNNSLKNSDNGEKSGYDGGDKMIEINAWP